MCHLYLCPGKIPKEYYITEEDSYNKTSTYVNTVVKKGAKLKLHFDVEDPGVFLKWETRIDFQKKNNFKFHFYFRWDFKTDGQDIKFGVRAVNTKTGEKFNEVELKRVVTPPEETGFVTCQAGHKCE